MRHPRILLPRVLSLAVNAGMDWDVFLCHASEDKADVVRPLAEMLQKRGLSVWLDEMEMKIGDALTKKIDEGLGRCRFGAVILSPAVLAKDSAWVRRELDALATREVQEGRVVVLPIWHQLGYDEVAKYSATLASKLAASTSKGIEHVADEVARRFEEVTVDSTWSSRPAAQPVSPVQGRSRPLPWTHPHTYMTPEMFGDGWPHLLLRAVVNYVPAAGAPRARIGGRVHQELPQLLVQSPISTGVTWQVSGHSSSVTTRYTANIGNGRQGSVGIALPSTMTQTIKVIVDLGLNDQRWPIPLDILSRLWADTLDTAIACDPIVSEMTTPRPKPDSVELFIDIARDGSSPFRDLAKAIDFCELGPRTDQDIPSVQWADLAENVIARPASRAIVDAWTDTVADFGILTPDDGLDALARVLGVA